MLAGLQATPRIDTVAVPLTVVLLGRPISLLAGYHPPNKNETIAYPGRRFG